MITLEKIYNEFNQRLGGNCCLAGGSVRDTLMNRTPKDFDIFKFGFLPQDWAHGLETINLRPLHNSEPYLQGTVAYEGAIVQVMQADHVEWCDCQTVHVGMLLDTFDWNVSRFAYDGDGFHQSDPGNGERRGVDWIRPGGILRLNKITFPVSTLRRGYRFSERFDMEIDKGDLLQVTQAVTAALTKAKRIQ